jgi:hypothetical protein
MKRASVAVALLLFVWSIALPAAAADKKTHLFILSGQSNMAGLNPDISFTPTVTKAFADDQVIVVKDAVGGQPIRRWYKKWKPAQGDSPKADGALYDRLIKKVSAAIKGKKITSITFVWMQGERDAKEKHGTVYEKSLLGLLGQLSDDLKRKDVNFVIGRLSDYDNDNKKYPHWTIVRKAIVKVGESGPRGSWVDTDDLNGPKNGLHYNKEGYKELGKRFADKSIALVKKNSK